MTQEDQIQRMSDWCEAHISPREYYLCYGSHGVKLGGEGWELAYMGHSNSVCQVTIEDERMRTLFILSNKVA